LLKNKKTKEKEKQKQKQKVGIYLVRFYFKVALGKESLACSACFCLKNAT